MAGSCVYKWQDTDVRLLPTGVGAAVGEDVVADLGHHVVDHGLLVAGAPILRDHVQGLEGVDHQSVEVNFLGPEVLLESRLAEAIAGTGAEVFRAASVGAEARLVHLFGYSLLLLWPFLVLLTRICVLHAVYCFYFFSCFKMLCRSRPVPEEMLLSVSVLTSAEYLAVAVLGCVSHKLTKLTELSGSSIRTG